MQKRYPGFGVQKTDVPDHTSIGHDPYVRAFRGSQATGQGPRIVRVYDLVIFLLQLLADSRDAYLVEAIFQRHRLSDHALIHKALIILPFRITHYIHIIPGFFKANE